MIFLLNIISLSVLIFSFSKIKWGITLYLLIVLLVPSLSYISIPFLQKWAGFNAVILVALCMHSYLHKVPLYIAPIKHFIFLFLFYLILIPLQKDTPLDYQLNNWLGQSFRALILPLAMLTVYKEEKSTKLISWVLSISIIIACVYGLFLLNLKGFNPYLLALMSNASELEEYSMGGSGRVFGRIGSVFPHPMTFGVFLICAFNYCLFKILHAKSKKSSYFAWAMLILVVINTITCGVRSVIAGIVISALTFLVTNKKFKYFIWSTILLLIAWLFISSNRELEFYITSIFNSSNSAYVQGSSATMRLEQLAGCFSEISNTPIIGHGYNWTAYYSITKGDHPIILAFESLVFVILCNWGLSGCFAWLGFLIKFWKKIRADVKNKLDKYSIQLCLTISYLSYTLITGDYCYMMYWVIFYCVIYLEEHSINKKL